jgi:hypothetical protein
MGIKNSHYYVPSGNPTAWRKLLEDPEKNWKIGYSALALAYCWEEAQANSHDFPVSIQRVFRNTKYKIFQDIKLLLAFPEYKVPLVGGLMPSVNDIFILAKGGGQLISVTVEGKVNEPFDKPVSEWKLNDEGGKIDRLKYLCEILGIIDIKLVENIYYQLIHRTASAIIEAEKFKANNALMLVHSFGNSDGKVDNFEEYKRFLALFNIYNPHKNSIIHASKRIRGVNIYFGWVDGDIKYLEEPYINKLDIKHNWDYKAR